MSASTGKLPLTQARPRADFDKNLYNILSWADFTQHTNSNGFIFERPNGTFRPGPYNTLGGNYAKLMEKCDLTGERRKFNYNEMHKRYKERIYSSHDLAFWGWCWGEKYADKLVSDYMGRNNRLPAGRFPVWRKPVILSVPAETFIWRYHPIFRRYECLNEDLLLMYAQNCDVLLINNFVVLKETNLKVFPIIEEEVIHHADQIENSSYYFMDKHRAYFDEIYSLKNHFGKQTIYDYGLPFEEYAKHKYNPTYQKVFGAAPKTDFEDKLLKTSLKGLELAKHKEMFKPAHFAS